ncbi:MAG: glycosyltransferase [Nanoarchaeota archaeon]
MKFFVLDNDERLYSDPTYEFNKGSFGTVSENLNKELKKLNCWANEKEADWIIHPTSLNYEFGFRNKKRAVISSWESTELPYPLVQFGLNNKNNPNFKILSINTQTSNLWNKYGIISPVVDLATDYEFFQPQINIKKNEKFTILSVTCLNFRSGINFLLSAFRYFAENKKDKVRLIIKNTDERAVLIPRFCDDLISMGFNVQYILERCSLQKIRELYSKSHLLCYNVLHGGGFPTLEAAAMELPCLISDFCQPNLYPHSEAVKCQLKPISEVRSYLCNNWGLAYTFPENWVNEATSSIYWLDEKDFVEKLEKIYQNYTFYENQAKENRQKEIEKWNWTRSAQQLIKALEN